MKEDNPPRIDRFWLRPEYHFPLYEIPLEMALPAKTCRRGYDGEEEARELIEIVRHNTMMSYERCVTLVQQVRHLEESNIAGDFVECGAWKGGAVGLMALGNLRYGKVRRQLHLFDSFAGLPEPTALDGDLAVYFAGGKQEGRLEPIRRNVGTLADNKQLLEETIGYDKDLIAYHQGWFQDTMPQIAPSIDAIALLRLDGDWYESTMVSLECLFPKVVPGGFIVIDDYGHWEGCRKAVQEYFKKNGLRLYLHHIDYTGRYCVKE